MGVSENYGAPYWGPYCKGILSPHKILDEVVGGVVRQASAGRSVIILSFVAQVSGFDVRV